MAINDVTKLAQLINPEVMGDMISASLPHAIRFINIAAIDNTLVGQPGDTITVPTWKYSGDAKDVAEGEAIQVDKLEASKTTVTVKKAGKAVALTDEAVLSGYGDPVGQATLQIQKAIVNKLDNDILAALKTATLHLDTEASNFISYDGIVNAVDLFAEEDDTPKLLFINSKQLTQLRKDPNFIDKNKFDSNVIMTGAIGMICGCQVIVSNKIADDGSHFENYIVCAGDAQPDGTPALPAVTVYMKRNVQTEGDRDVLTKTSVVTADQHYAVALTNPTKVLKVQFKSK